RAVEFTVDEAAGTVEQVWSYGDAPDDRLFACFQGGAKRLPETGNTFITYGGVATIDGVPSGDNDAGFGRARLVEVTQSGDVVFDLWIDAGGAENPVSYSVFRAEHMAE
ncbi:MAG: aryl-sulfate sulfotransferase, partial [Alphaproteobacteria bacterium]|nr:aryl-sulfate sulfotransferase [Alphaproteobacteria bacterium]